MAATTQTYTITVLSAEVKTRDAFGPRYAWQTTVEHYNVYVSVKAQTDDGEMIYFDTPGIGMCVTSAVGVAVVTYDGSNDWITEGIDYCVTAKTSTAKEAAKATIKVGDKITIKGKVKKEYRTGKALNYVKLICRNAF